MLEFVLGEMNAPKEWQDLSDIAQGFVEALFFISVGNVSANEFFSAKFQERLTEGNINGSTPDCSGVRHVDQASLETVAKFCANFAERAGSLINAACQRNGYDERRIGNDLYYTYCGHGVGFYDREMLKAGDLGDALAEEVGSGEAYVEAYLPEGADDPVAYRLRITLY
jgi:hypothetical protein